MDAGACGSGGPGHGHGHGHGHARAETAAWRHGGGGLPGAGGADAPRAPGRSSSPSRALKLARLQDIYTVRVRVRPGAVPCAPCVRRARGCCHSL